jgi:hypothetical protein
MFVDLCKLILILKTGISLSLLMIIVAWLGFILWDKNLKFSIFWESLNVLFKGKVVALLKYWEVMEGRNILQINFINSVKMKAWKDNWQFLILHNKMGCLKGSKNQTVMEMTKSMLHEKGLPKTFWAEVVCTTVYLMNRCPTNTLRSKT